MIETLYVAFRSFVESPEYDPFRYERLTSGEEYGLLLQDESVNDLGDVLAALDAEHAGAVLMRLDAAVYSRGIGTGARPRFPVSYFLEEKGGAEGAALLFPSEWDAWSQDRRLKHLDAFFGEVGSSWSGANLRTLRSRMIEDWLASP